MSNKIHNTEIASSIAQADHLEKIAYCRPQLTRYGALASLTQSGPSTSTTEFFTTFSPISQQP